ncbi:hypothetical protein V8E54_012363 [Elaphomyces granulatus]|jgi:hypothetical protein
MASAKSDGIWTPWHHRMGRQTRGTILQRATKQIWSESIAFRFEHDDTNAVNDTEHFQPILKCFGFPRAEEYIISGNDKAEYGTDIYIELSDHGEKDFGDASLRWARQDRCERGAPHLWPTRNIQGLSTPSQTGAQSDLR